MKVYHVIPRENLTRIIQEGLVPQWHHHAGEEGIFVERSREEAEVYSEPSTVTLRINLGSDGRKHRGWGGRDLWGCASEEHRSVP